MKILKKLTAGLFAATILGGASAAHAADGKIRIGLMFTLSGPAAVLGQQERGWLPARG